MRRALRGGCAAAQHARPLLRMALAELDRKQEREK